MRHFSVSPRAYVALYLDKKRKQDKTTFAQNVYDSINGNATFATPGPFTLAQLQTAIDNHNAALVSEITGGALEKQKVIDTGRILNIILTAFGGYVEGVANEEANLVNAASIILSAGMELRRTAVRRPVPDSVTNLKASFTYRAETILLSWRRSKNALTFTIFMTTTPGDDSSWKDIMTTASRKVTVDGLTSGQRYYFKVVALGTGGSSPDSSIASCMAA